MTHRYAEKENKFVVCPFDPNHTCLITKLPWHLAKCKAKKKREALGLPIYHCKWDHWHVFLDKESFSGHEESCPKNPKNRP